MLLAELNGMNVRHLPGAGTLAAEAAATGGRAADDGAAFGADAAGDAGFGAEAAPVGAAGLAPDVTDTLLSVDTAVVFTTDLPAGLTGTLAFLLAAGSGAGGGGGAAATAGRAPNFPTSPVNTLPS